MMRTRAPAAARAAAMCEPMKPAPPVMSAIPVNAITGYLMLSIELVVQFLNFDLCTSIHDTQELGSRNFNKAQEQSHIGFRWKPSTVTHCRPTPTYSKPNSRISA